MGETNRPSYRDIELIEQMKANIETGTALVMEQYAGLIWTVCSNYLQDKEDVKECVNEVFAEFSLNYDRFRPEKGSLRNYLCKIASNCAADKHKNNLRHKRSEDAQANQLAFGKRWEDEIREKELLDEALDKLPVIDSQILRMKYYGGLSFKEIAETLHLDYNLVRKRSERSRKKLLKIILLGLLLALLAACAAIIFRQYRVSEQSGFLWTVETAAYGNEDPTEPIIVEDVSYQITDAVYYDSQLKIEITAQWIADGNGDWKEELKKQIDKHLYKEIKMDIKAYTLHLGSIDEAQKTIKVTFTYEGFIETNEDEEIAIKITLLQGQIQELILKKLPILEYEDKDVKIELDDGSFLALGPNHTGDSNTILSLFHTEGTEYELTDWLTNHFGGLGTWNDKMEQIVLMDQEDKETAIQRVMSDDFVDGEIQKNFQLYFPKMEPGDYTLKIPYLCLMKQQNTENTVIELPKEDDVKMECDYKILFPDQSGYHITGITRKKTVETTEAIDFDGNVLKIETMKWNYYLSYELFTENDLVFCFSRVEGNTEAGTQVTGNTDHQNQYFLQVQQEDPPEKITVAFTEPIYILDEEITAPIRVD